MFALGAVEEFGDFEVEQHAHQVTALVGAGDVVRLVLHPHAAVRAESECIGQVPVTAKRRCLEAAAGDVGDLGIEAADQRDERLVGDSPLSRAVIAVEERAEGDERLALD